MIKFLMISIILIFQSSCSFPNKSFLKKTSLLSKDLPNIAFLIRRELPNNTYSYATVKVKNAELKTILNSYKIEYIGVIYKLPDTIIIKENVLKTTFDSSITLTSSKLKVDEIFNENLIYFFCKTKSKLKLENREDVKQVQINDSICLQKMTSQIVKVY